MVFYKDRSCHHYGRQVDWPKSIRSLVASFLSENDSRQECEEELRKYKKCVPNVPMECN